MRFHSLPTRAAGQWAGPSTAEAIGEARDLEIPVEAVSIREERHDGLVVDLGAFGRDGIIVLGRRVSGNGLPNGP